MRIVVAAVGRLKRGPESDLAERYRERAVKSGRGIGLRSLEVIEIAESRARETQRRMLEESIALANVIPKDAATVLLDPRGETVDSNAFTKRLRGWNDGGRDVVFVIGGPDGLAPTLSDQADLHLAFGALTWPHQLVRIMLLEQIYRATTILSGHPYHRE
ncbi:MAG: rRNA (pseudouridine1915-N3)-methyltransferase [Hyphomicrobiales bacterium]|jgi:23S rRNA (pseudouridine1915-N3)-methyltransferase|nr:rRNA (pseudouridine1915-N3)-methyltransferase [Hyphomicrobiales bacterium]